MGLGYGYGFGFRGSFRVLPLSCPLCLDVGTVQWWRSVGQAGLGDNYPRLPRDSNSQCFSSQSPRKERGAYTFLYPFNLSGSGTPSERYTMIGAKPTKVAIKKRKRRHMQRLRRTFRGVIKRGRTSPSYRKSAAIVEEKGLTKSVALSASRCELANQTSYWIRPALIALLTPHVLAKVTLVRTDRQFSTITYKQNYRHLRTFQASMVYSVPSAQLQNSSPRWRNPPSACLAPLVPSKRSPDPSLLPTVCRLHNLDS